MSGRPLRGSIFAWCFAALAMLGLGSEFLHPGHHVHGEGETRLHHHHFFLGDHRHDEDRHDEESAAADWPSAQSEHRHADKSHGHGDQHGHGDERDDPESSSSVLVEDLWSETARTPPALAERSSSSHEASQRQDQAPHILHWQPRRPRGPPAGTQA